MATNPRIGQVDHLLDDLSLTRVELHGKVQNARTLVLRLRHMSRDLYDELLELERELAGPEEQPEPGSVFTGLDTLRNHRALRKQRAWDGTDRRKRRDDRHLEAVA